MLCFQEEEIQTLQEQISQNEAKLEQSCVSYEREEARQRELEQKFRDIEQGMKSKIEAADGIKVRVFV